MGRAISLEYPDGPPTPGVFDCGDTLVRTGKPGGYVYWCGPALTDSDGQQVQVIRTCGCGGWFRASRDAFQLAPPARVEPPTPGMCS